MNSIIIDCKGLKCPHPVIETKKYFESIDSGTATILVDNEVAKNNISKFSQSQGFKFQVENKDALYHVTITKEGSDFQIINLEKQTLTIVVGSNCLGTGDDKLGLALMKSYLYAVSESDSLPTDLLFLNSGVKLTIEDSECLDSLKKMQEKGTTILSCGTCLDFYGLKEKIAIGEITNMYTIVEKMNTAMKTIKL